MTVFVALLRAVNVGGAGSLPMADLKAICEGLGFSDVKTYIQSGNVLFRADEAEKAVEERLDEAIGKKLGKRPGVMVRSRKELDGIVDDAPFPTPSRTSCSSISCPKSRPAMRWKRWWRPTARRRSSPAGKSMCIIPMVPAARS